MSEAEVRPTSFIRQTIDEDLTAGKRTTVHTCPPPELDGYLYIGYAKSTCLNFDIAQDYQGQCNPRFDDTNPARGDIEHVESIRNDMQWLGFHWSGDVCYPSDYFDQLHQCVVELINKGLVYVDELSPDEIREYRNTLKAPGKNNPYRDCSMEENLTLFGKVYSGGFEEGKTYLRTKIDVASPFIVMRDPVLYRIKFAEHHQIGNKQCVHPMYDFTHCINNALEGITHSLCTLELQDDRRLYDRVLDNINIPVHPRQYKFSCLNLEYTVMSKRKLNQLVVEKHVEGWDDPRMPTISGLHRRGYIAKSIHEFCKRIGVTRQDNTIEMALLESYIREDLNENTPCAMVVIDPVKLVTENYPQDESKMVAMPNHPNKPEMDNCEVSFSAEIWIDRADLRGEANGQYKRLVLGKEVRLHNAYVIRAERMEKDAKGNITTIFCTHDADTLNKDPADGREVKGVIHWVSAAHMLPVEIRLYDCLFSVPSPGAKEDSLAVINPDSLAIRQGYAGPSLAQTEAGKVYQLGCEDYSCLGSRYVNASSLVLNHTVGLRDTWAKVGE